MSGEELSNGRDGMYIKPSKKGKYSTEMRRKLILLRNGGSLPEYQDGNYLPMINPVPSGVQPVSKRY